MMCGKADETPAQPPVPLSNIEPFQTRPPTSIRPPTSTRPSTRTQRPHSRAAATDRERPQSSRQRLPRPSTSSRSATSRPSSSRHVPKTSGGEASYRDRSGSQFPSIREYPEDKTIIRRVTNLTTLVDQHAEFYYPHDIGRGQGEREPTLASLATRHAAIRRCIAKKIIESIIMQSSSDTSAIANDISNRLAIHADPDNNDARKDHIQELCNLGDEIRGLVISHPSKWRFASWDDYGMGFIIMTPEFLKDGEQVVPRQIFRIR